MKVPSLVASDPDTGRCVQAAFRMAMAAMTGIDPGFERADELTGYSDDRGTWQFRMLVAFANAGLEVCDVEALDVDLFLHDPKAAIREQVLDDDVAEEYIADTDLTREMSALKECQDNPHVSFLNDTPTVEDAATAIQENGLLLCHVNSRVLTDRPGHSGHMVVVEEITDKDVLLHDPGPPSQWARRVEIPLFEKAWAAVPNYISVTAK